MTHQRTRTRYVWLLLAAAAVSCLYVVLFTDESPPPASENLIVGATGAPPRSSDESVAGSDWTNEGMGSEERIRLPPAGPSSPGSSDAYEFDVQVRETPSGIPVTDVSVNLLLRGRISAGEGVPRERFLRGKTDQLGVCTFTSSLADIEEVVATSERSYKEIPGCPVRVEAAIGAPARYELTLWVPAPTRFEGIVTDASGSPVAAASIVTLRFNWQQPTVMVEADGSLAPPKVAITAEDGTFAFDMRKAAQLDFVVVAAHEDFGISDCCIPLSYFSDSPAQPMHLLLAAGSELALRVVDSDGEPLKGFELPLSESLESLARREVLKDKEVVPLLFTVLTDTDGAARLTLSGGAEIVIPFSSIKPLMVEEICGTRIQIDGPSVPPTYQNPAIRLIPGGRVEVKVVLHAKECLVGRVVDEAGEPVCGAILRQGEIFAKSDEHGRFAFKETSKILLRFPIVVEAEGFVPRRVCLQGETAAGVESPVIRLCRYRVFEIRVVPTPHRAFLVQGTRKDGRYDILDGPVEGKMDERGDGTFVFNVDDDREESAYDLCVIVRSKNGGHEGLCFIKGVIQAHETPVSDDIREFVVDPDIFTTKLHLTIRDTGPAASENIRVRLRPRYLYAGTPTEPIQAHQIAIEERVRPDRQGQVEITDLQPGIYDVGVYVPSSGGGERFACMAVELDGSEHAATLSLPSPSLYGRLQVMVFEKNSRAQVWGYIAELHDQTGKRVGMHHADAQGVVDVEGLSPGRYTITVLRQGAAAIKRETEVHSGQTTHFTVDLQI